MSTFNVPPRSDFESLNSLRNIYRFNFYKVQRLLMKVDAASSSNAAGNILLFIVTKNSEVRFINKISVICSLMENGGMKSFKPGNNDLQCYKSNPSIKS